MATGGQDGFEVPRFSVGDRVLVKGTEEWPQASAVIVAMHGRSLCGQPFLYQVELAESGDLFEITSELDEHIRMADQCASEKDWDGTIHRVWQEPAWWLAALEQEQYQQKTSFDAPGHYLIVSNTFVSTTSDRSAAERVVDGDLKPPMVVEVLEVRTIGNRVRGRVRVPKGWISLRHVDDSRVLAAPVSSAYARLWRHYNKALFEDLWSSKGIVFGAPVGSEEPSTNELMCAKGSQSVDAMDEQGRTALCFTVQRGWLRAAAALLEMNADPSKRDELGYAPLHYATKAGSDIMSLLLQAGADPSAQAPHFPGPLQQRGVAAHDASNRTALHYCAVDGDLASVRMLLDAGADPDVRDASLRAPLHLAMQAEHAGVVQELLRRRVDVNAQLDGWTPLMQAAHTGNARLAQQLIAARANLNAAGRGQATAVQLAERSGSLQVLALLRESGCQVSCRKDDR